MAEEEEEMKLPWLLALLHEVYTHPGDLVEIADDGGNGEHLSR